MTFSFDEEVYREGSNSVKWDFTLENNQLVQRSHQTGQSMLSMWISDMDFPCPSEVSDALAKQAGRGVFGYSHPTDSYYEVLARWMQRRHGWQPAREWVVLTPGIVPALNLLVRTFAAPGEKVLVQRPVYHQFMHAIENQRCEVVSNSLVLDNGRYRMDFDDLASKAADPAVKMALLCTPHNPMGRVWTRDDLLQFSEICCEHDVLVVADEVFGDLVYPDSAFASWGSLGDEQLHRSVICTAASKTFNLSGLHTSNIVIVDRNRREQFTETVLASGLFGVNAAGIVATEAAYTHGEPWLQALLRHIQGNYHYLVDYLAEHLPQVSAIRPEAGYLVWLDCRELHVSDQRRSEMLLNQARVHLEAGAEFGPEGRGFERMNIACTRSQLADALRRMERVLNSAVFDRQ